MEYCIPGLDIHGGSVTRLVDPATVGITSVVESDITFVERGMNNNTNTAKYITVFNWRYLCAIFEVARPVQFNELALMGSYRLLPDIKAKSTVNGFIPFYYLSLAFILILKHLLVFCSSCLNETSCLDTLEGEIVKTICGQLFKCAIQAAEQKIYI